MMLFYLFEIILNNFYRILTKFIKRNTIQLEQRFMGMNKTSGTSSSPRATGQKEGVP